MVTAYSPSPTDKLWQVKGHTNGISQCTQPLGLQGKRWLHHNDVMLCNMYMWVPCGTILCIAVQWIPQGKLIERSSCNQKGYSSIGRVYCIVTPITACWYTVLWHLYNVLIMYSTLCTDIRLEMYVAIMCTTQLLAEYKSLDISWPSALLFSELHWSVSSDWQYVAWQR